MLTVVHLVLRSDLFIFFDLVVGMVSGGGGEDAVQERFTQKKWSLWDPEQHSSEQQLCTGQREVWYTVVNSTALQQETVFSQSIYCVCVCVCVGLWAAQMAATLKSRTQRLRSKSTPTQCPPPARPNLMMSSMTRKRCRPSAHVKPCTRLKVMSSRQSVDEDDDPTVDVLSWSLHCPLEVTCVSAASEHLQIFCQMLSHVIFCLMML